MRRWKNWWRRAVPRRLPRPAPGSPGVPRRGAWQPDAMDAFVSVIAGTLSPVEFFDADNVRRTLSAAPRADLRPPRAARPPTRSHARTQAGGQQPLALLRALAALALCPAEELRQLVVVLPPGVLDVGLEPERVAQARLGEPDDVVVLVLGAGDVAGLGGGYIASFTGSRFR